MKKGKSATTGSRNKSANKHRVPKNLKNSISRSGKKYFLLVKNFRDLTKNKRRLKYIKRESKGWDWILSSRKVGKDTYNIYARTEKGGRIPWSSIKKFVIHIQSGHVVM